jgi:hypothetical protein
MACASRVANASSVRFTSSAEATTASRTPGSSAAKFSFSDNSKRTDTTFSISVSVGVRLFGISIDDHPDHEFMEFRAGARSLLSAIRPTIVSHGLSGMQPNVKIRLGVNIA